MNPRFIDYSHLAPGLHYERRPASERRSSASFTDGMSNMRRELSSSSHVTESSETTNYIHSNIGDSISSPNPVTPAYVQYDSGAFFWSNGQIQVEDDNTFISDDHSLLPPATQLPQLTLSAENDLLNVESGVNDPDALFEFIINRLRQQYRAQSDRLSYARNLARIYLGVDSIHSFLPSRERSSRPPKPRSQPRSNAQNSQKKEHYLCLLCDSPLHLCSRGAFKRHVNEMHQSKSLFLCMHCTWHNPRKDKLRDHIRVNHGGHTVQELNDRELMLDPPSSCDLCESYESPIHKPPFPSWQAWFEGIEMHCRVEDYEKKPGTGSNPPDQNGGNAGGASGGYFPSAPFFQGPNAGGPSLGQGSNWTSGASFSQWASNIHTRSVSQPSNPSLIERPSISKGVPCGELAPNQKQCASKRCHIRHRKGASVSSSIELGDSRTETLSKKDLPPKTDSALAKLSNKISLLRLDYKRKDIPRLSSAQAPLRIQNDLHAGEKMISGKFYLSEVS